MRYVYTADDLTALIVADLAAKGVQSPSVGVLFDVGLRRAIDPGEGAYAITAYVEIDPDKFKILQAQVLEKQKENTK